MGRFVGIGGEKDGAVLIHDLDRNEVVRGEIRREKAVTGLDVSESGGIAYIPLTAMRAAHHHGRW